MGKVINEAKKSKKKKQMKQEYKIDLTILGIIMMLGLPIAWALWFGSNIAERGNSPPFLHYGVFIFMIGYLIVIICYSACLATGFLFLSIGLVETVEQLILSHSYPFLKFSMFEWDILLLKVMLLMLGALIERKYIRGGKDVTWREAFAPFILILIILIFSFFWW